MQLLAVETATEACSAALVVDGVIHERYQLATKRHTQLIMPMIEELMTEAGLKPCDLDVLAFGQGPGSFTGVRIATGVIHGIALAIDAPVVPVSTLAALAQDYFDHHPENLCFIAMDARMAEIFWGVYERDAEGFAVAVGEECVTPAGLITFPDLAGVGIGSGWGVYEKELNAGLGARVLAIHPELLPKARAIARLGVRGFEQGLSVPVERAMPVYLRDKVAKKESERGNNTNAVTI